MISHSLLEFAALKYGFDIDTLQHIPRDCGKVMNEVYSFYKHGKKHIVKFEPKSVEHINQLKETNAAMDFHYYLAENKISTSMPLKTVDGELVISMQDNGEDYIITAFAWLNGQTWGYVGSNEEMSFNWGKVMGDMHRAAMDYTPPNKYDVQKDIFDSYYWGSFFDELKRYPSAHRITQDVLVEITALPTEKDSFGVIHGDMHQGNFFVDGTKVSVIDFGDSIYGWFALDIAISLCHALWWDRKDEAGNDFTYSIIENFSKGYLSANLLSNFWISKIPLFMKYRQLCMDPEKNGLGCTREEWITHIENDILFDGFELKTVPEIIKNVKSQRYS